MYAIHAGTLEFHRLSCVLGQPIEIGNANSFLVFVAINYAEINADLVELFGQLRAKIGPIGQDQCYAFNPIMAFGGEMSVETASIANASVHSDIQLQAVLPED
jgi:hypothetical protein